MRRHIFIYFILAFFFGCSTTSRVDEIFKIERDTQMEIWVFNVEGDKIPEQGSLLYLNTYNKDNLLVETIKYLEDEEIQWDNYHIYTYKGNKLFEEYYFTVDNFDNKLIDGKKISTYFPNGKLKQWTMFNSEKPKDDTVNVKWAADFTIKYKYASDSLIEKRGCSKDIDKCGITTYQYDTTNKTVIETFINEEDISLNTKDFFKYNSNNELLYKVHWYRSSYDSTTYIYQNKKLIEESVLFQDGQLFKRTTFEYNNIGQIVESKHFNTQNKLESVRRHKYKKIR